MVRWKRYDLNFMLMYWMEHMGVWKFLSQENFRWFCRKKRKFPFFLILDFCFHDASLKAYLALYVCAMDMVDSALKTLGLVLLKYDKIVATDFEKNVPRRLP